MAKGRVTIDFASHYPEWDKFRKQPAVASALLQMGERIANRADNYAEGYISTLPREGFDIAEHGYEVVEGSKRLRCIVWTKSYAAKFAEAKANTLTNSLWAGAGIF